MPTEAVLTECSYTVPRASIQQLARAAAYVRNSVVCSSNVFTTCSELGNHLAVSSLQLWQKLRATDIRIPVQFQNSMSGSPDELSEEIVT